ncbi:MAG: acetoin utilization protein AcuC [Clostridiales bacterium]|nr:acetoin utilization protein AcuC [Clostridiales bacterium]
MRPALFYSDAMAAYDLGPHHPLKPERFTLAVDLMRAYGLIGEERNLDPVHPIEFFSPSGPASGADLALVHDEAYIATVKDASAYPERYRFVTRHGIGVGDTPAAHGLHDVAALICGGTIAALSRVLDAPGPARSFAPAGGLHHAHRNSAAGFCIYNDPAVAIAVALRERPGTRIAYLDIDAHHGDGVQEAFYDTANVLTISLHESGRYLFPGTGHAEETGIGAGTGYAINVPLPPFADAECYKVVFDEVVAPVLAAFSPDALVAQCGADAHHADPLTHLGLTLSGMRDLYRRIVEIADASCGGRLACCGGGGYGTYSVVPRAWTMLAAVLAGVDVPDALPEEWRARSSSMSDEEAPRTITEDTAPPGDPGTALEHTRSVVTQLLRSVTLLK